MRAARPLHFLYRQRAYGYTNALVHHHGIDMFFHQRLMVGIAHIVVLDLDGNEEAFLYG